MIKITNLNKYYDRHTRRENHIINDLTIEFPNTGLVTFFGPSGCGKTTLLNVIGGLDSFDSGTICYEGVSYEKYQAKTFDTIRNELIGYIFQNYNLIDTKSVYDNVVTSLEMLGVTDPIEIKKRAENALNSVGMLKYRKRNVLALSGGQRQRVAIARALAKNPKVIIADEPTGNLDSNNTYEVMNIIKSISKTRLVILVSHEKNLVDFYADRIIELSDGKIINDYDNVGDTDLLHNDLRNIYLGDLCNTKATDNLEIYHLDSDELPNLTCYIKNNELYIESKNYSKVHVIDNLSEVKIINSTEKEYKENVLKAASNNFDMKIYEEYQNKEAKKKFIPISKSIGDGFSKSRRFLRRGAFTYIALIIATIIYTFLFASLSRTLYFNERDYKNYCDHMVIVEYTRQDEKSGVERSSLATAGNSVNGFLSSSWGEALNCYVNVGNLYQTVSDMVMIPIYPVGSNYPVTIIKGRNVLNDNEIVISKWNASDILKTNDASKNGLIDYDDLLGKTVMINNNFTQVELLIVGILEEESYVSVLSNNILEEDYIVNSSYSTKRYIYTTNKDLMVEELSKTYHKVYDPASHAKFNYFMDLIENCGGQIITIGIITLVLLIYLVLMVRAQMLRKIKDIGILRSIGARKSDIYSIFIGEMIALTTVTSTIAYTVLSFIFVYFSSKFDVSSSGLEIFKVTPISFIIGLLLPYGVNILASVVPVASLLRKTPVEIIKKYDI